VGVGEASVVALAALGQQCLGLLEEDRVEQRLIGLVDDIAEGDLAEVAAIAQDAEDDLGAPSPPGAGAMPVVQSVGDGGCAGSFGAVAGEDLTGLMVDSGQAPRAKLIAGLRGVAVLVVGTKAHQ
jgi:hypothetical protein